MSILGQPVTYLATYGAVGIPHRYPFLIPLQFNLQVASTQSPGFFVTSVSCQAANAGIQFLVEMLDANLNTLNISGATSMQIFFQAPDGTQTAHTASYLTNGIDGQLYYVTTVSDLIEAGLWYIQAEIVLGGSTFTTMQGQFEVFSNL